MADKEVPEPIVGEWSPLPGKEPTPEVKRLTEQMKQQTEEKLFEQFPEFNATLYRIQIVEGIEGGINYVVKVEIGSNNEVVHVQFFELGMPVMVEFKDAIRTGSNAALEPLKQ